MALADILKTLREEAEAEIASLNTECDARIQALNDSYDVFKDARTTEARGNAERRATKVAERIMAKAQHRVAFLETEKVQQRIEAVFAHVTEKLTNLPEKAYTEFLEKKWTSLPSDEVKNASFMVADERADATRSFLKQKGIPETAITTIPGLLGGFVCSSKDREFDCSFTTLMTHLRNTQSVTLAQRLTT